MELNESFIPNRKLKSFLAFTQIALPSLNILTFNVYGNNLAHKNCMHGYVGWYAFFATQDKLSVQLQVDV